MVVVVIVVIPVNDMNIAPDPINTPQHNIVPYKNALDAVLNADELFLITSRSLVFSLFTTVCTPYNIPPLKLANDKAKNQPVLTDSLLSIVIVVVLDDDDDDDDDGIVGDGL